MSPAVRHEIVGPHDAPHRLRIAHLSDLHLWCSDRKLREIEHLIEPWQPDVLALTGDYADTPWGQRLAVRWITKMAEAYPLCWVAGNHDHWWGRQFLKNLEAIPGAHAIDRQDALISGQDGMRYRFTCWERLTTPTPRPTDPSSIPTVALLHDPGLIEPAKLLAQGADLLLAGHLHGGQITLWRDRAGRPQPAASCYRWLVDRMTIATTPLIVSRGLGATLPLRFRAPKEIVMIDLSVRSSQPPAPRLGGEPAPPRPLAARHG